MHEYVEQDLFLISSKTGLELNAKLEMQQQLKTCVDILLRVNEVIEPQVCCFIDNSSIAAILYSIYKNYILGIDCHAITVTQIL